MLCRLCLRTIFDTDSIAIFSEMGSQLGISQTIGKYFWFQIKEDDSVSNCICFACWQKIESFHVFYLEVEESQKKLSAENIVVKTEPQDVFVIKTEVPDDDEYKDYSEQTMQYPNDMSAPAMGGYNFNYTQAEASSNVDQELKTGVLTMETEPLVDNWLDQPQTSQNVRTPQNKIYRGAKGFQRRGRLKEYDEQIRQFLEIKCDLCGFKFEQFGELTKHFRIAHNRQGYLICCKIKIFTPKEVVEHIQTHLDPDYFKCDICHKRYTSKYNLRLHKTLIHKPETIEKKFECEVCQKNFKRVSHLNAHKVIHMPAEQREFFCDECNKLYPTEYILKKHKKMTHTKKPCDICGEEIRHAYFQKHRMEHAGISAPKVQCPKCDAWLKNKPSLKIHMRRHERESRFNGAFHGCPHCPKKSFLKKTLIAHLQLDHPDKLSDESLLKDDVDDEDSFSSLIND